MVAVERGLRVAVLGASTAEDLGLDADGLGTAISIGGIPFTVIGILQPKGGSGFQDPDDQVMVPVATVQKYFVGGDSVRTIGVSVDPTADMDATSAEITSLLRERHELAATDDDDLGDGHGGESRGSLASLTRPTEGSVSGAFHDSRPPGGRVAPPRGRPLCGTGAIGWNIAALRVCTPASALAAAWIATATNTNASGSTSLKRYRSV